MNLTEPEPESCILRLIYSTVCISIALLSPTNFYYLFYSFSELPTDLTEEWVHVLHFLINIYEPIPDYTWDSTRVVYILTSFRYSYLQCQLKLQSTADTHSTSEVLSPSLKRQVKLRFLIAVVIALHQTFPVNLPYKPSKYLTLIFFSASWVTALWVVL